MTWLVRKMKFSISYMFMDLSYQYRLSVPSDVFDCPQHRRRADRVNLRRI
ncbi:hypothetical protein Hdeb2414_s0065g00766261 [Helianthus debilis subsp. tardiflorus]